MSRELIEVARAALAYIDALPADVVAALPTMPGFDRDWAENALHAAEQPTTETAQDNGDSPEFEMPAMTREKRQHLVSNLVRRQAFYNCLLESKPDRAGHALDLLAITIALAALTAKPTGQIFQHPYGKLFWSISDESNAGQQGIVPYYLTPPVHIVDAPIAWLNDAYLARGVVDGEAGAEDQGPGYIPVYRHPFNDAPK